MSLQGSGGLSPTAAPSAAAAVEDTSSHWAPHGAVLTACVVGINVLMILLIFFFFWRFFSGKRGRSASAGAEDDDDDDEDTLPVASPWATSRNRGRGAPVPRPQDDVASSLPVHAYSIAAAGGKPAECAVCIVELRDGDAARLLPRCGHRFHADCVGAWLLLHATCPLCRAIVVAPAAAAAAATAAEPTNPKDDVSADCPV